MNLLELNELDYVYWYWDYVLSTHAWAVAKLKESKFALEVEIFTEKYRKKLESSKTPTQSETTSKTATPAAGSGKSKKKNKSKLKQDNKETKKNEMEAEAGLENSVDLFHPSETPTKELPTVNEALVRGRALLYKGLFRLLCLLSGSSAPSCSSPVLSELPAIVNKAEGRYTTWSCRFEQRFKPFKWISNPPMLSHDDFVSTVSKIQSGHNAGPSDSSVQSLPPQDDFASLVQRMSFAAATCFQGARKFLDDGRKIRAVANANEVSSKSNANFGDCFGGGITALSAASNAAAREVDAALITLTKALINNFSCPFEINAYIFESDIGC